MFWSDDSPAESFLVPREVVDVSFRVVCPRLPLDHAQALLGAVRVALPWLDEEPGVGIHSMHGAESGNGWYRPEPAEGALLYLSRRTRFVLRLPARRVADAGALSGRTLTIAGHPMEVGASKVRSLSAHNTIYARHVVAGNGSDETEFANDIAGELAQLGITVRKLLCGRAHAIATEDETLLTRSVLLADLEPHESVRLQEAGVGTGRKLGCGLFVPHKGIGTLQAQRDND